MELWFLLALLTPAIFAAITLIDDNLLRNVYRSASFGAIVSGLFGLLPLSALLFINISIPSLTILLLGLSAGVLTVIYYYFYFRGLEIEEPSIVIALFSLAPALIPFLAFFSLNESLTKNQYLGLVVIVIASLLLTSPNIKKIKFSPAFFLVGLGAFIFAVISIISKYVYTQVDFWTGYMLFACGMGIGALGVMIFTKKGRAFPKEFKKLIKKWFLIFLAVELLGISAEFTNNLAVSKGPVSLVKVIEGIQPIYVLLFALLLYPLFPKHLREAVSGKKTKKIILMLVMIFGLFLIYTN